MSSLFSKRHDPAAHHDRRTPEELFADWKKTRNHRILTDDVELAYLAEGAANIIYRLSGKEWDGKLLRLRKNLKTTEPTIQAHANFVSHVKPLLPDRDIVAKELIVLNSSSIISKLNGQLKDWEAGRWHPRNIKSRPVRRQGVYLAQDDYGLLIDDMSPGPDEVLIHFKPKWLHQSPNAPPNSKRCRVCALRAQRRAAVLRKEAVISSLPEFCPLTLISDSDDAIEYAVESLLRVSNVQTTRIPQYQALKEWTRKTTIFRDLAAQQLMNDPKGVLARSKNSDDMMLRIAMMLRDVSVYIVHHPKGGVIRAGLGDLDLKSSTKLASWIQTEQGLIDEGWYEANEVVKQPLDCWIGKIET